MFALHLSVLSFPRGCCHLLCPPSLPKARWDPVEHLACLQPHDSLAACEMCSRPWWWCCSSLCQQADLTDSDLSYPNRADELLARIPGSPSVTAQGINFASELNVITPHTSILCTRIRWYVAIRWTFQISRINLPQLLARLWPFTIAAVMAFHSPSSSLTAAYLSYKQPNRPEQDVLPKWCPGCCGTHSARHSTWCWTLHSTATQWTQQR